MEKISAYDLIRTLHSTPNGMYKKTRWLTVKLGQVLWNIVQDNNVSYVLESGTANGFSSLCMAMALPKDGKVETFDIVKRSHLWERKDWRSWRKKISFHLGSFAETAGNYVSDNKIMLVFLDGDHRQRSVRKEIKVIYPRMKAGDLLVFDDFGREGGVTRAVHRSGILKKHEHERFGRLLVIKR